MPILRKNPNGDSPIVSSSAYLDGTAIICGKVIIDAGVYVGPYAVIRADELDEYGKIKPIHIKRDSNIQDGVVIHSKSGARVLIGERTSISHRAIVHGPCEVGDDVFVGFNSVLFDCALGDDIMIEHCSLVDGCNIPSHRQIPPMSKINCEDALSLLEPISSVSRVFSQSVVQANKYFAEEYG